MLCATRLLPPPEKLQCSPVVRPQVIVPSPSTCVGPVSSTATRRTSRGTILRTFSSSSRRRSTSNCSSRSRASLAGDQEGSSSGICMHRQRAHILQITETGVDIGVLPERIEASSRAGQRERVACAGNLLLGVSHEARQAIETARRSCMLSVVARRGGIGRGRQARTLVASNRPLATHFLLPLREPPPRSGCRGIRATCSEDRQQGSQLSRPRGWQLLQERRVEGLKGWRL